MRELKDILLEQMRLNNSQLGAIASIAISPTPEMAYGTLTGARNSVSDRNALERAGYINVNDQDRTATLTDSGQDVLRSENLMDDTGELTERGEEIVATYREDRGEWKRLESFKYF